jgi:hypothetical protein
MTATSPDTRAIDGLQQVRTAYRLIHAYHRRLLDLLLVTRDAVAERHGPLVRTWWSRMEFSMPPKGSSDVTDRWAYDFVPLQDARFVWASAEDPSKGGWYFGICHRPDSALEAGSDGEPDALKLGAVADAQSMLEAWAVAVPAGQHARWDDVESRVSPVDDGWWGDQAVHTVASGEGVIALGGFGVDLARLWTLDGARAALIDPLTDLVGRVRATAGLPAGGAGTVQDPV